MPQDTCIERQNEVEAALDELKAIQSGPAPFAAAGAASATPIQGSDMSKRVFDTVGRLDAAKRRYRAGIRALAECLGSRPD